jgi:hypothetical protein
MIIIECRLGHMRGTTSVLAHVVQKSSRSSAMGKQFRFLFYQLPSRVPSSFTPFLLFDIQILPADLTLVWCMFHHGQGNRRRNCDRKQIALTTRKREGGVLITECEGSDPMLLWGSQ